MAGSEKGKLLPTDIGIVVNDFLMKYFPAIMDYNFTAKVEQQFDTIAEGKARWTDMIEHFYDKFEPTVEKTMNAREEHKAGERELGKEPKTGKPVFVKIGRFGPVVQIGKAEDKEKPRFAQLPADKSMETITLDEALEPVPPAPHRGRIRGHSGGDRLGTLRPLRHARPQVRVHTQGRRPHEGDPRRRHRALS